MASKEDQELMDAIDRIRTSPSHPNLENPFPASQLNSVREQRRYEIARELASRSFHYSTEGSYVIAPPYRLIELADALLDELEKAAKKPE